MGSKVSYLYPHPTSLFWGLVAPLAIGKVAAGMSLAKPSGQTVSCTHPPKPFVLSSAFFPLRGMLFRAQSSSLSGSNTSLLTPIPQWTILSPNWYIHQAAFPQLKFSSVPLPSSPSGPGQQSPPYPRAHTLPQAGILLSDHFTGRWWCRAS